MLIHIIYAHITLLYGAAQSGCPALTCLVISRDIPMCVFAKKVNEISSFCSFIVLPNFNQPHADRSISKPNYRCWLILVKGEVGHNIWLLNLSDIVYRRFKFIWYLCREFQTDQSISSMYGQFLITALSFSLGRIRTLTVTWGSGRITAPTKSPGANRGPSPPPTSQGWAEPDPCDL